ncbi:MAG: cyclic nucleotide-binding domain-containing protein [bacterium]|nr:cyclic nucleotide-binding domain-containing protein [bacterium]
MTPPEGCGPCYTVLCVAGEAEVLDGLVRDVRSQCGAAFEVEACPSAARALDLVERINPIEARVPLVMTAPVLPDGSGVELLLTLHERPDYRATRKLLLSDGLVLDELAQALEQGAVHRVLCQPWDTGRFQSTVRALLTTFFVHHAPDDVERFGDVLDVEQIPRAFWVAHRRRQELGIQVETLSRSFLADLEMSTADVEQAMIAGVDEALGNPERRQYPAGAILLEEGQKVDGVSIVVSGQVQLFRVFDSREITLHRHSAGRVVGLLALARGKQAAFNCRALTDVEVIPLTLEQLETALQRNASLSNHFVTVLVRSLTRRNRRVCDLQVEIRNLTHALTDERDQLAETLEQLENAQLRLVESEKMAQLGQLSAGVAHELNNPIAAIQRAVDFISEDLLSLLVDLPDGEMVKATMVSALTSTPLSTREQRKLRATLAETVGNDVLAQRLVKVGITTPDEHRSRFRGLADDERARQVVSMERYHQLGESLRNLSSCSERVSAIVSSLRSYSRADETAVAEVNLHEGLENTLLMFGHALREVEVQKEYADLPSVECRVGEINQVWTNIISNGLQAMKNQGTLRIETDVPDADHVRVRITDSGGGVPPEHLERVFELNFTTKAGQASFGLGMGLAICRQIVTRHGGTIEMESQPGRTCVAVVLPVRSMRMPGES